MIRRKLLQIIVVCLQAAVLVALFLPARCDYAYSQSVWGLMTEAFSYGEWGGGVTFLCYFIPPVASGLLVALLEGRGRYAASLISATMGLTLSLAQFWFPALQDGYLYGVYRFGAYLLLLLEALLVVFSFLGVCIKDTPDFYGAHGDTAELPALPVKKI
jgi:hypothetical protein